MAGNYLWCYEGDNCNTEIKFKERPVDRYSLNGQYMDSYSSIKEASEKLNINYSSLSAACRNRNKTAGNYIWRYSHDSIDSYPFEIIKGGDSVA